jgi:N-acetyl-gamma-glutamylphosphate reductase
MDLNIYIDGDQGTTGLDLQNRLQGGEFRIRTLPANVRKDAVARGLPSTNATSPSCACPMMQHEMRWR